MIREYAKFFINGGILGVAAWGLQLLIYHALDNNTSTSYAIASILTYLPLVLVNYMIQRRWIFKKSGIFSRFVIANLSIMLFVSLASPLFRRIIDLLFGIPWGDNGGFVAAALISSIPSFFIKRHWVFGKSFHDQ